MAKKTDVLNQKLHQLKISLIQRDITELEQQTMLQEKNRLSNEINFLKSSFNNAFKVNYSALVEKARLKAEQEKAKEKQKALRAKLDEIAKEREFTSMIKTIFEGSYFIADVFLTEWKFHSPPNIYIQSDFSPDDKSNYDKNSKKRKISLNTSGSPYKKNSYDEYDEVTVFNIILAFDTTSKEKQKALEKWFLNSKRFSEYSVWFNVSEEFAEGVKKELEIDSVVHISKMEHSTSEKVTVMYDPETKKYLLRTSIFYTFTMSKERAKEIGNFKVGVDYCKGVGNPCNSLM